SDRVSKPVIYNPQKIGLTPDFSAFASRKDHPLLSGPAPHELAAATLRSSATLAHRSQCRRKILNIRITGQNAPAPIASANWSYVNGLCERIALVSRRGIIGACHWCLALEPLLARTLGSLFPKRPMALLDGQGPCQKACRLS